MRRLMATVVILAATAGPAAAQEGDTGKDWKVLADVNRVAVGWKSDAAKASFDKATTAYDNAEPSVSAVLAEWNKNKKLYEVKMPAGVYGETMGTILSMSLDVSDGNSWYSVACDYASSASLDLDYGDLAYAEGLYETANGYYESAYDKYQTSLTSYDQAATLYTSALANAVGAATLMSLYP